MPFLRHSLILVLLCASCTAPPTAHSTPALPMEEFIAQVLDPLAGQIADEWAVESKAEYAANHPISMQKPSSGTDPGAASGGGPGGMMGGFIGAYVAVANQEAIEKYNAGVEARREPLKKDLLALFTRRTRTVEDQYSVCVDGAERRYGVTDKGFVRLPDGPGPCEKTEISTKGTSENTDR